MSNFYGKTSSDLAKSKYDLVETTYDKSPEKQFLLPPLTSQTLRNDPKWMCFTFSRHKFVSKMLAGLDRVLEVGCWEGVASLMVAKSCKKLVSVDYYVPHIEYANSHIKPLVENIDFLGLDILDKPIENRTFDGAFSLDVLEHIDPSQEHIYMKNIAECLKSNGVFIVGTPSIESQAYAGEGSRLTHINCKSYESLKTLCLKYYSNVFMFGMNDEVLHTGFGPMCHYLFALCVGPLHDDQG